MNPKNKYAVIMAGGVGSRFWPVSKTSHPKQFHDMLGTGKTLLQQTYSRLAKFIPENQILILTNDIYEDLVLEQIPNLEPHQLFLEPAMRNTAPCILLAALKIHKLNPEAVMLVAPSDHWIEDEKSFGENLNQAFEVASKEKALLTLGIQPTFPNTGYGYIEYEKDKSSDIKDVIKFTEKPDYGTAKSFLNQGNFLWNAGIFIWSTDYILNEFKEFQPDMFSLFNDEASKLNTSDERQVISDIYPKAENISIDYAILENSESVKCVPANFDWNDLGTWGSLHDKLDKDSEKNAVVNAKVILNHSSNNIIRTEKDKIVVIQRLNDFIIVEDEKVLVIAPKSDEQDIKKLRQQAIEKFGDAIG
ncbi:MAG: mannose-1-phosphate guanylyltransferase [Psychroflexus halocasei]